MIATAHMQFSCLGEVSTEILRPAFCPEFQEIGTYLIVGSEGSYISPRLRYFDAAVSAVACFAGGHRATLSGVES